LFRVCGEKSFYILNNLVDDGLKKSISIVDSEYLSYITELLLSIDFTVSYLFAKFYFLDSVFSIYFNFFIES